MSSCADDDAEIAEPGRFQRLVEPDRLHRRTPRPLAVELEHQRLAVAVVEAGADPGPLRRAGDAGLAGDRIAVAPHRGRQGPAHQPDLAAEQRAIDLLPDPGRARMGQRGERAAEGEDRAGLVGDRDDAGAQRLARRRIGLGDAAQSLRHRVGAGQMRIRPVRPVARDRDVDQLRIDLAQFLIAEPVLLGRAGTEILAEDVGLGDQLAQDLAPLRRLQVQRDALHAAVVGLEIGARHPRQHGRAARIVADFRHLDLDHLGAEIGHQHVRHRAGLRRRAGDDLDALQRPVRFSHDRPSCLLAPG